MAKPKAIFEDIISERPIKQYDLDAKAYGEDETINLTPRSTNSLERIVSMFISLAGIIGGLALILSNINKQNIFLSPAKAGFNFGFWAGIILLIIGIVGASFWYNKR